jgi:eukaryotic-like serine/threonine-protein kinase
MGVVYLAEDMRLGRPVALKTLAREYAENPERRKRFFNEARAAAALNHVGIASVYELGEHGEDVFIIFEYVEGVTLRALLQAGTPRLDELLDITVQIAAALEAAHAKGIVHRDLKPENVIRRPTGEVKVLDFGLARTESGVIGPNSTTQSYGLTQVGTVMGTVGYMSPEQLEGKPTDFRSDIFSFGVMLYELATGTHPFAGETPVSTIANVMTREPPPLTSANTPHPPELERIVRKCLRKSRDDRYQSTRDLVVDLKDLRHHGSEASPRPQAPEQRASVARTPHTWWLMAHSLLSPRRNTGVGIPRVADARVRASIRSFRLPGAGPPAGC